MWMERPQGLNSPVSEHPPVVGHPTGTTAPAPPDFGTFTTQLSTPAASQPGDYFYPGWWVLLGGQRKTPPGQALIPAPPHQGLFFFCGGKLDFGTFLGKIKS